MFHRICSATSTRWLKVVEPYVITYGFLCAIPLLLLYALTLGPVLSVATAHLCVSPYWKWIGPVPIYKSYDRWDCT